MRTRVHLVIVIWVEDRPARENAVVIGVVGGVVGKTWRAIVVVQHKLLVKVGAEKENHVKLIGEQIVVKTKAIKQKVGVLEVRVRDRNQIIGERKTGPVWVVGIVTWTGKIERLAKPGDKR